MRVTVRITKEDIHIRKVYMTDEGPVTLAAQRRLKKRVNWYGNEMVVEGRRYTCDPQSAKIIQKSCLSGGKIKPCKLVFKRVEPA